MKSKPNLFQKTSKSSVASSFALVLIGASSPQLQAATWLSNGTTDWNTASNWDTNSVPNGQNAIVNTNTGSIATITGNPPNPNDVIVGNGGGTNGLVNHTAGTLITGQWFKVGHNGGAGTYNLGVTGGSGTYTGLSQGSGSITVGSAGQQLRLGGDGAGGGNGTLNVNTTGTVTTTSDISVGKNGSGTLNMDGGTITKTGGTFIVGEGSGLTGLVRISGGTVNNTGEMWIGNNSGGNGTMTLSGGTINQDSWYSIGRNGATGVLNISGGLLTKTATNSHFVVGDGSFANSTGTLVQTGGAIELRSQLWIGKGLNAGPGSLATGTATISGGTVQVDAWLAIGRDGATGTLTINGTGSVTQGSPGDPFSNLELTNQSAGSATINLDGGTLTAMGIVKSGAAGSTSTINFNGGTLRAGRDNTTFMQGLATARVRDGGAAIDTRNFNVTIGQSLFRSGDFGDAGTGVLRKTGTGTLTLSGGGDNAGVRARVEVGTLVLGKTSSASVHAVGTDGGTDHALQIVGGTARLGGTGGDQIYINSAVNMTGGTFDLAGLSEGFDGLSGSGGTINNSTAATTSTLTLGQNNSTGSPLFAGVIQNGAGTVALVKTGSGTQTLSGANTHSGGTTINGGTLAIGHNTALGSGTVTMSDGVTLANNSAGALAVANAFAVGSTGSMKFAVNNNLTLTGAISGGASGVQINVQGPGTLTLTDNGRSVGSGATPAVWTVNAGGTLALTRGNNLGTLPSAATAQIILDNGTFSTITVGGNFFAERGLQVNAAGGAWLDSAGGIHFTGAVLNNGPFTVNTPVSNAISELSGVVSGSGSLTKSGAGTLVLSAANTYTGDTFVNNGVLAVNGSSIADTNQLVIDGGIVQVTGTETVNSLYFGGVQQAGGTWGSTASAATHKDDSRFSGTGVLSVTTGPAVGGFDSWVAGFGLAVEDRDPADDPDGDGHNNLLEYTLGGNPSLNDAASIAPTGSKDGLGNYIFTFRRSDLSETDGTQFVEYGNDLVVWGSYSIGASPGTAPVVIQEDTPSSSIDTVTVTIPTQGATKFFARLKVVK